jgi:hypothetical protein
MDHNLELTRILRTGMRVEIRPTSAGFSVRVDGSRLCDVETFEQAIEQLHEFTAPRVTPSLLRSPVYSDR